MTSPDRLKTLRISFGQDPTMVPGFGKYERGDLGWIQALTAYNESTKVPFPVGGTIIEMPDTPLTIALAGDAGTNTEPFITAICGLIREENPDYTIHLGDVYYKGAADEEGIFANQWPTGKLGSFTLCSNHEMYSGGAGYLQTLNHPTFVVQQGKSYFALRNKNWLIIGLDTAHASISNLYQEGLLDDAQLTWLKAVIAEKGNRQVILLSHHDPFNPACLDSTESSGSTAIRYKYLLNQILKISDPFPCYWYWGHIHMPIVYSTMNGITARCIGHGGIPYLPFAGIPTQVGDEVVKMQWAETISIATGRAPNGFMILRLNENTITEQFVDELGRSSWQSLNNDIK